MISAAAQVRNELVVLWRTWALPVVVMVTLALAVGNVLNGANAVGSAYAQVEHTRAMYAESGLNFDEALSHPATVTGSGSMSEIDNFARYDYDAMVVAIRALSPAESVNETLGYLSFVLFPALFFLVGLWMSTVQRAAGLEKTTLVRVGVRGTVLARQAAVVAVGVCAVVVALATDLVGRGIARAEVSGVIPISGFPPLHPEPPTSTWQQLGVTVLVIVAFGWAGLAVGALAGSFAVPAIVFVAYNFVLPVVVVWDPRNWFLVIGRETFAPSPGFVLAAAVPTTTVVATAAALAGALAAAIGGQLAARVRNPVAS